MEESSAGRKELGQEEERASHALRRKAELLSVVFSLPKPDIAVASVENMPETFELPEEMMRVFKEIMIQEDTNEIEYTAAGDTKRGQLFFTQIRAGSKESSRLDAKNILLTYIGRRRIRIHSHPNRKPEDLRFSPHDIIIDFLYQPNRELTVVISRSKDNKDYGILMAVKGKENAELERERYLSGLYLPMAPFVPYRTLIKLSKMGVVERPLQEVASIFQNNGCVLYSGIGHIDSDKVIMNKIHPFDFAEFEKDPQTGFMLPEA